MAEALASKLHDTVALPHFVSLLQHLLMIPGDEKHIHLWRLFDMLIQQLSLQVTVGQMSADVEPSLVKIDIEQTLSRLRTQHEYEQLEKELANAHEELELERKRVIELENRVSDLQDDAFSRISDFSSSPSDPCHSPTPTILSTSTLSLPPVKPPTSGPPPPPPSAAQLKLLGGSINSLNTPQKNVPKPSATLRTLNWSVLPPKKIQSTVWENIPDEKVYKNLDLEDLAMNFVAGKGHQDDTESIYGTLQRKMRSDTLVSVIDAQRSQNCTIMLSKLKLTNREIRTAMLTMDEKGRIPKDMIEQMLKYVPSREEMNLLKEAVEKYKSPAVLAIADRFLLEVGQIPRYEQRLKCLHIMRTYKERVDELMPCINSVIRASDLISSNKKLKQFLAVILATGNYLNYGKKAGNASGFAITSLNAVAGVKNAMRCDRNLMHYIVGVVEDKYSDLLTMPREMSGVFEAARCSRSEMEQEMRQIEASLRIVSAELRAQEKILEEEEQEQKENMENMENNNGDEEEPKLKRRRTVKGDKFIKIVRAFLTDARTQFKEMGNSHAEMNSKFFDCARYFAADAPGCSPDEFFGIFAKFLNTLSECRQQLWEEREEIERVKRQTLARSVFAKRGGRRRQQKNAEQQDFEKLISALQSGEIFSEDLCRLRSSFRVTPRKKLLVQ
uniref:FH2 domain-containing protein n=1 Tax=Steinernema glaseri TaxID=37863 RepID=A0A1I7YAJ6_9BILA